MSLQLRLSNSLLSSAIETICVNSATFCENTALRAAWELTSNQDCHKHALLLEAGGLQNF